MMIDVQDGGLARSDKYNVTFGVINITITRRESKPEIIRCFCRPESKQANISDFKKRLCREDMP